MIAIDKGKTGIHQKFGLRFLRGLQQRRRAVGNSAVGCFPGQITARRCGLWTGTSLPLLVLLCMQLGTGAIANDEIRQEGLQLRTFLENAARASADRQYSVALENLEKAWNLSIAEGRTDLIVQQLSAGAQMVDCLIKLERYEQAGSAIEALTRRYARMTGRTNDLPINLHAELLALMLGPRLSMREGHFAEATLRWGRLRQWLIDHASAFPPQTQAIMGTSAFYEDHSRECGFGEVVARFLEAWQGKEPERMASCISSAGCVPLVSGGLSSAQAASACKQLADVAGVKARGYETQTYYPVEPVTEPAYVRVHLEVSGEGPLPIESGEYKCLLVREKEQWKLIGVFRITDVIPPLPPLLGGEEAGACATPQAECGAGCCGAQAGTPATGAVSAAQPEQPQGACGCAGN